MASEHRGTALVTGASVGIGAAIVRRLREDGYRVIACARRLELLQALAADSDSMVLPFQLDIADSAAVRALPGALPEGWQDVDILINNAGLAKGLSPFWNLSEDDIDQMLTVNVKGLMLLTRALLPRMVERDNGLIINIGSTAANYAYPGGNVYGATKALVEQFTMGLKADLLGTNVRVTCLEPGLVGGTEFSNVRFSGDGVSASARAARVYEGTRPLMPEDVAATVAFIVQCPPHVNVNLIELMPTCQAPAAPAVARNCGV